MSILLLASAFSALGLAQPGVPASPAPTCSLEGSFRLRDPEGNEAAPLFGEVFVETPLRVGVTTPEHFELTQQYRQFIPRVLVVKVGDTVDFINRDSEPHEVHSEGEVNPFVVKRNAREKTAGNVEFKVVGLSTIGCEIHKQMRATIRTVPNSFHVHVSGDGKWKLSGLPRKPLQVVFWAEGLGETRRTLQPCASPPTAVTIPVERLETSGSSRGIQNY